MKHFSTIKLLLAAVVIMSNVTGAFAAKLLTAKELVRTWTTTRTVFDINYSKAVCYLLDYNSEWGDGFAHNEDGSYVTMSVKDYCEQFAKDWNADENNTQKITAEEAADRTVTGSDFVKFEIDGNRFVMRYGYAGYEVTDVSGAYTYDEETGVITVDDEIESEKKKFTVSVDPETDAVVFLNATEWYPLSIMSYDQTKDYFVFAPTYYYCDKYSSSETGISSASAQKHAVAIYNVNGVRTNTMNKGINIVKMSDGSTRKTVVSGR